ncbi:AAA family ATPase [Spirulina sp. 06S082]|uniref:nSTAND1 domain-containing NTPase n=1 Tax=Spirulina sp. 06S082 TaxID=3110248 RepID=UPI002B208AFD|nr:AAA family ATPase [Spirulina sp. 06S082]MEA5469218.1 AAA family ATPase [Spirulina sp. 06S082]
MKLTTEGKKQVDYALTNKAWTLEDFQAKSDFQISTIKNFSAGKDVRKKTFVSLCDLLGIRWERASGQSQSFPVLAKCNGLNSQNPFMKRGMLDTLEEIYGRDRELRQVFEFLNSGTSVALVGCGGMGTSSLLRAIEQKAPKKLPHRKLVYLNMREILDRDSYYQTLAAEIGITAEPQFQFQRELKQQRVLLLLDKVEQLREHWFDDGVRNQLRAWANSGVRSPLRLVVAAHRPLTELFEDSGMDSPFANICHELQLQPWDAVTVQGFIEDRLAGTGVQFTEEETEEIIAKSGGIPSQVMLFCYECYEDYRD